MPQETTVSQWLHDLLYNVGQERNLLQRSPVLSNVWKAFVEQAGGSVDLILTPHRNTRPAGLASLIRDGLLQSDDSSAPASSLSADLNIAHNQSVVALSVSFDEMIQHLLPLTSWYRSLNRDLKTVIGLKTRTSRSKLLGKLHDALGDPSSQFDEFSPTIVWWLQLTGQVSLFLQEARPIADDDTLDHSDLQDRLDDLASDISARSADEIWDRAKSLLPDAVDEGQARLFRISLNRAADTACFDSVRTVKADAAVRVFEINTGRICWAVLDSGIDPTHEAFFDDDQNSRVTATYDFTKVRRLIALASAPGDMAEEALQTEFDLDSEKASRIRASLVSGGDVDWEALVPALEVDHGDAPKLKKYVEGLNAHGTHVAGILGGRFKEKADDENDFLGVCPNIQLIDIRILDREGNTTANRGQPEFDIIAALQFISHLNAASDEPVVHGANLSIQLQHDPEDFACGRTPVCEECNRLVANGVVVVAAAGNMGINRADMAASTSEGAFRGISIADPGNAKSVITVGSTHRKRPHSYGVSFFSSRGPTGDGRQKPDLVAPGEKILGPVLGGDGQRYDEMQGTSQAAPHVSGAAAMLMSRHTELIGDPERVKRILCETATDLGRERHFQGAGLVDVLRALQST